MSSHQVYLQILPLDGNPPPCYSLCLGFVTRPCRLPRAVTQTILPNLGRLSQNPPPPFQAEWSLEFLLENKAINTLSEAHFTQDPGECSP